MSDAPDSIDTLLVPGGVPADFTFARGTHGIPEEPTPDTIPGHWQWSANWPPGRRGSPPSAPGRSYWPPSLDTTMITKPVPALLCAPTGHNRSQPDQPHDPGTCNRPGDSLPIFTRIVRAELTSGFSRSR